MRRPLVAAIAIHYRPTDTKHDGTLSAMVYLGDLTAMLMGIGIGIDGAFYAPDPLALTVVEDALGAMDAVMIATVKELSRLETALGERIRCVT